MKKRILVIGGAGFIGSHLVDELLALGHEIVVYDNLEPQVHGNLHNTPEYLAKNIHFIHKDIRDEVTLLDAIQDIDVIFHLAAMVGVGQSMYQIKRYIDVNVLGTSILLDILVNKPNDVKKLVIASSMSTYGEGQYSCENCNNVTPKLRTEAQLKKCDWELDCPECGKKAIPISTKEEKFQECTSIYALTKKEQEKMSLLIGKTYGIDTTALRLFNVYGSRQSLSNPYTGVCAIFSSNLLSNNPPIIYEDGNQTRDFVHIKDVCQAFILSMEKPQSKYEVFNVGTGIPIKIKDIAHYIAKHINPSITPSISNKYRLGDIRHCFSDISKISSLLGYKPEVSFENGILELIDWVKFQRGKIEDKSSIANKELREKGLIK